MSYLPYFAVAPFVLVLLGIAIIPLARPHWWEHNRNKALFAALLAVPAAIYLGFTHAEELGHASVEYVQFILLLGSLFIVSGGIVLREDLPVSPAVNVLVLVVGSVLASIIGTTGASMLLIRPFLRLNQGRVRTRHLPIFFIFCISNAGGLLTPLGDPPLFLGYLRGVPFEWTFKLWPEWLFVNGILWLLFFTIDQRMMMEPERTAARSGGGGFSLAGSHNVFLMLAIVGSVVFLPAPWRELAMIGAAAISIASTQASLRKENGFTYGPIAEVAILFAAIFVTMVPALDLLRAHGPEMGLTEPLQFFFATGLLSSFLDNAPTYVTFFELARSLPPRGVLVAGVAEPLLVAISLGSVLMGANTYIGNGPNFMVKSICDEAGFKTPTFFGYMAWSGGILIPLWIAVALVFL